MRLASSVTTYDCSKKLFCAPIRKSFPTGALRDAYCATCGLQLFPRRGAVPREVPPFNHSHRQNIPFAAMPCPPIRQVRSADASSGCRRTFGTSSLRERKDSACRRTSSTNLQRLTGLNLKTVCVRQSLIVQSCTEIRTGNATQFSAENWNVPPRSSFPKALRLPDCRGACCQCGGRAHRPRRTQKLHRPKLRGPRSEPL